MHRSFHPHRWERRRAPIRTKHTPACNRTVGAGFAAISDPKCGRHQPRWPAVSLCVSSHWRAPAWRRFFIVTCRVFSYRQICCLVWLSLVGGCWLRFGCVLVVGLLRWWLGCLRLGWLLVVGLALSLAGAAGGLGGVAWSFVCLVGCAGGGWGAGLPLCWRLFAFVGFILCRPG